MSTSPRTKASSRQRQQQTGQATSEFIVLALVLVPLLILIPLLGKYLDMMHAAEAASRYVAFQGTIHNSSNAWQDEATLAQEVRRRFFSQVDSPIKTDDAAGDFAAHRNALWTNHRGSALIENFGEQVSVSTRTDSRNAIAAAFFASSMELPRDNVYTAIVTARPADVEGLAPFDSIGLEISRRTVLLVDPWTARSASDVRQRIRRTEEMVPLEAIRRVVDLAGKLPPFVFDPELEVGHFDWDIVPCDRLIGGCP